MKTNSKYENAQNRKTRTCPACVVLQNEVDRLQRMVEYSQDQEARRAGECSELSRENYELRLRLRDEHQLTLRMDQ